MKKFTKFEIAAMKRTAANVHQFIGKRDRLQAKINEIQTELDVLNKAIEAADAPTKISTGGYGTEDIFKRVITDTGKTDKQGNPIKTTSYVLLYPETVIPIPCTGTCVADPVEPVGEIIPEGTVETKVDNNPFETEEA